MVSVDDAWFALAVTAHEVPFQRSTSECENVWLKSWTTPTATHDVAVAHDTPLNAFQLPAEEFGLVVIVHVVPFHRSISVDALCRLPGCHSPTAKQLVGLAHEMPCNSLSPSVDLFGVVATVQVVPSQCSTRVFGTPPSSRPAAKQLVADGHDTDINSAPRLPGCGTLTTVHAEPFQCSTRMRVFCPLAR